MTFPDKKLMEEYKRRMEEAKMRDHRRIGTQQKLFFFDTKYSPGSAFFLPRGMTICKRLIQVLLAIFPLYTVLSMRTGILPRRACVCYYQRA